MITLVATAIERPVRLPFRVLAASTLLLCPVAIVLAALLVWKSGLYAQRLQAVVLLPGILRFVRLACYAALRGTTPSDVNWPFASRGVFQGYALLVIVCWLAG